jgi:methyl-accepting chemotaxis protein
MAKTSAYFRSDSLQGKIRLSTTALAFFVAFFGLFSYCISFVAGNSFYAVFIPFLFLASAVFFFGRWLSNEIVIPVEKVSLLAKSFERGVSTTIPKTSGSSETDELVHTIARLSSQVQKLLTAMEELAAGNLEAAFSANVGTDRASQTFQKLLVKVSESIHAQQNLENLENALIRLSDEISPLKNGNLDTKIQTETAETKEIARALTYLIEQLSEIVAEVKTAGSQAETFAVQAEKTIQAVVQRDETNIQEMNQASRTFKQVPNMVQKIFEELSQSSFSAHQSIEKARHGTLVAQQNLQAVGTLRRQIQDAIKHIERLNERSQETNKIAKTVEDLAHRTTMVALNASVQANELGEAGRGFVVVSEEIERLAERAGNMSKNISALNKTIQAEISEVESALNSTVSEAASLSKFAIETGDALGELEKYVARVLNLQNKLISYSQEQSAETEQAFQVFVKGISETENSLVNLKESAASVIKISARMADLQSAVADFKISPPPAAAAVDDQAVSTYPNLPSIEPASFR